MVDALSSNKERATAQYWKFCEQTRFNDLFLRSLDLINDKESSIVHVICDCIVKKRVSNVNLAWQCWVSLNKQNKVIEIIDKVVENVLSYNNPSKSRDSVWFRRCILDSKQYLV